MIHSFDAFELDISKQELRKYGALVPVEPKAFRLIALLIENRERVVTKDELINLVWEGRAISDASVSTAVKSARRALDDNGQRQRFIKTVWGRGFRFVGNLISNAGNRTGAAHAIGRQAETGLPSSITVTPFVDVSDDTTNGHVAESITEAVTAALTHIPWLIVVDHDPMPTRNTRHQNIDEAAIRSSTEYVVAGQVYSSAENVRVTAQLLEGSGDTQIWSGRYDRQIADLSEIQEAISQRIVEALSPLAAPAS